MNVSATDRTFYVDVIQLVQIAVEQVVATPMPPIMGNS